MCGYLGNKYQATIPSRKFPFENPKGKNTIVVLGKMIMGGKVLTVCNKEAQCPQDEDERETEIAILQEEVGS